MSRKQLTLGLFGFGCVGQGLHEVLQRTPTLEATIKRVCVKHANKVRSISTDIFTYDKNDILNDPDINVVVELIDDADAAYDIVKTALRNGKAVVSANKKMIAQHFNELLDLQKQYNVPLLYEAACCASIPIIRNLEEYFDNDLLDSIEGIVNGSTNYILTRTVEDGLSYAAALREAQANGFAETDPTLDTGGFDAKYKLTIQLAHAFGLVVSPDTIFNVGIDKLSDIELRYAREKGYKVKLVASASKTADGKIVAYVLPKYVASSDSLYTVDGVFNGIKTKSLFSDTQFFVGKGAGAYPTASAVLSDISALTYNYKYEYKKINGKETLAADTNVVLKVLLRFDASSDQDLAYSFDDITESYNTPDGGYYIGTITLHSLRRLFLTANSALSVVLIEDVSRQTHSIASVQSENMPATM